MLGGYARGKGNYFFPKKDLMLEGYKDAHVKNTLNQDIREAAEYANECFVAAKIEGLHEAIESENMERIKDLYHRRLTFGLDKLEKSLKCKNER